MDIRKNKRAQSFNLKRLAITATASALLTFHAEATQADSCPVEVIGTGLANDVCDFDTHSTVTVTNGGALGGISMDGYAPTAGQIKIDAGGILSNADRTGINIHDSTLSNGLINNGTISTNAAAILVTGSTVGGIANNGTIASISSTGIQVQQASTINGSISNSGTITSNGVFDDIVLSQHSDVSGNIINTGVLNANSSGNGILLAFDSTLNGNLVNSGTINAGSDGILEYITSNIHGGISNSGSINAGSDGIRITNESHVDHAISNTGLIDAGNIGISINSTSTVGSISNSGTINAGHTGIAVLSSSAISGGISNSGTIQGGIKAIYIDPVATDAPINIVGQHARIIGAVDATNSDFNITSGATFTSEGTFNVKNFNIAANAVFNMANSITAQDTVTNAGTLAIGNTTQTINSTNGYVQSAGGTLQIGLSSASSYGQLSVDHGVDLSASGNINVQVEQNSSIHQGDVFAQVISGDSLNGPAGGFNITDNSFLWNFTANTTSTDVNLTAAINPNAYSACQGDYCAGAANVIIGQVLAGNSAFGPYATLATESAFQDAASQATPELTNENVQAVQFLTNAVMDAVPMWSALQGESAGDAMIYQPGKVWVKPYGGSMSQSENNTVPGFNSTIYGVVVGRDTQLTDDWMGGGAVALGKNTLDGNSALSGQSIKSGAYQGILYATRQLPHNLYLAEQGLVGYENNDTSRSIPLYTSTATGSYGSWFTNIRTQLGWNAYANQNLVLTPDIDASYLYVNQNSYLESGSVMDLAVNSSNTSALILGANGNLAYHIPGSTDQPEFTLTGYAGLARNLLNTQPQVTATFVAGGPSFSTEGAQFNGVVFRGGLGVNFEHPTKPLTISLNYDLQAGNSAYNGVGSLTITYKI